MASGGKLSAKFKEFATKEDGKQATTKDITRWFTDAKIFGKSCTSNNLDIAFSAVKPKGKPCITAKELPALLKKVAPSYKADHKLGSDEEAVTQMEEKLAATSKAAHGATKTSKTGGVAKMTDSSQYTGAHKERFDASGKGKGKEGREDKADGSGYVGNYKGAGTYDKKK